MNKKLPFGDFQFRRNKRQFHTRLRNCLHTFSQQYAGYETIFVRFEDAIPATEVDDILRLPYDGHDSVVSLHDSKIECLFAEIGFLIQRLWRWEKAKGTENVAIILNVLSHLEKIAAKGLEQYYI